MTGAKPYRWQGINDWVPGDPRYREVTAQGAAATAEHARRLTEYARLRDEGLTVAEAGERLDPPVKKKTAYRYERESKELREAAS